MVAAGLAGPEPQPTSISDKSKIPARKHKMVFFIDFFSFVKIIAQYLSIDLPIFQRSRCRLRTSPEADFVLLVDRLRSR